MSFLQKLKKRFFPEPGIDEIEINIFGLHAKMIRKLPLPVPHEVSVYVPRLELSKTVKEDNKTTETSVVLNSLTMVSAPRHELSGHPSMIKISPAKH